MSISSLSDLDALVLSVRDTESKRLILEAVNAYRGGALRSALISAWVAVAYDIIGKIRELAARGEAHAKTFVDDLNRAIEAKNVRRLQEIENSLLDVAQNDFAFLLSHEATDLRRLFEDRDLCAHPAFVSEDALFTPSPELVRAHIGHAVQHLLASPPVQGKSAMLRLHRDLLGTGFPSIPEKVSVVMRDNYLHQTKDSVIISIMKGLLMTPFRAERTKFKGRERSIALAFAAAGKIRPDLFERDIPTFIRKTADELAEPEFLFLLHFVAAERRCWEWMSESAQIRMIEDLSKYPVKDLIPTGCFDALEIPGIAEALIPRVSGLNSEERFNIISENPRPQFVGETIKLYAESGSFRTAELRGEKLILAHAKFFNADELKKVIEGAIANKYHQILGAAGTSDILIKLFDTRIDLVPQTADSWSNLYGVLLKKNMTGDYSYGDLIQRLAQNGIEPPEAPEPPPLPAPVEPSVPPSDDEVPF